MADASHAVGSFLGGEISQFAQGRFDKPDYRISLNVCFNAFPVEIGPWTRRPGTMFAGTTRNGAPGRVIKFDFEQSSAVTLELTDGFLRARGGSDLATTNDAQPVIAISAANPAVVQTKAATTWVTGNTVFLPDASTPLLENRQFVITVVDPTHFSIADPLTGATIDGSTLGALATGATVARVQELATPYLGGAWSAIRAVQAETTDVLLNGQIAPQALTVTTLPSAGVDPVFAITPAVFNDGPYLDPFTNGAQATPNQVSGIISITVSFAAYDSGKAYSKGAFVTSSSIDYQSISDQNCGNTPASSPSFWQAASAATAINNGLGFLGSDVGRLVRLFSEPPAWSVVSVYASGETVAYNPSGEPGASTYWQSLTSSNVGNAPGADLTNWQIIPQGAAIWTWGRITGLSNVIDRTLPTPMGNMALFNGIAAPFDGNFAKPVSSSAGATASGGAAPSGVPIVFAAYVGKNFSASPQQISQATIYPPTDTGFGFAQAVIAGINQGIDLVFELNLRAKQTAPTVSYDGTLLARATFTSANFDNNLISNDQVTAWNFVWIELVLTATPGGIGASSWEMLMGIAQISLFSPTATSSASTGCEVEILGPPLLYTNPILAWRLGVYSNTTGWPTCGCYDDGRLWLGGAVPNRFDASTSNGIVPGSSVVNFAPTDQYGVVAASNGISETVNADSTNKLNWMEPDLQGIICNTQAGEFLILAPTSGSIAPNNITSRRVTRIGGANVAPCRTEHTVVFVQRYGVKLMEYFADVFSGKFSAPNLADKAQHIVRKKMAEIAYQSATTPIVWGRDALGALFGMTYKRDTLTTSQGPTFYAWHRHGLGSGRTVESLCVGPSVGGDLDTLTMVTNDPATNVRHVELLTDTMDEESDLTAAWFVDDGVAPSSTISSSTPVTGAPLGGLTINGLWHLNGKTVSVWAGGLDCGDYAVANGSCFVPFGDGIGQGTGGGLFTADYVRSITPFPIAVGFTFTSQGQIVRPMLPVDTGARNGPAFGKLGRAHRYAMKLVNTLGLTIGGNFARKMFSANFKTVTSTPLPPLTMFSGTSQEAMQDDYTYDDSLCWQVTRPYPATVVIAGTNRSTMDQ